VDAAQAIVHMPLNAADLEADFLVFSGHKLYGPTGIGVLYAKGAWLSRLQPFEGGGDMISRVTTEGAEWAEPPRKFEAGTPPIAEAIALGSAVDFVQAVGFKAIQDHDQSLLATAIEMLRAEGDLELYGPLSLEKQHSILSFNLKGVHPHDLATIADSVNVQIRGGHHCAMPTLKRLGLSSSARLSFGVYSSKDDLAALVEAIRKAIKVLG
jgi:cysteine desulfurase/selenocysteine lyase